jgi:hypothetical protein
MKKNVIFLFVFLISFVSCSKSSDNDDDSITVNDAAVTLNSSETHLIVTNQNMPTFKSENEFVADVSSVGLVTAKHVGSTYIDINGIRKVAVTVDAKYSLYEPLHDVTLTKSQVIKKKGSPSNQNDTMLLYKNPDDEILVELYMFSASTGKLKNAGLVYSTSFFVSFNYALAERYEPIAYDEKNYYFYYIDALTVSDAKLMVMTNLYNLNYCLTLYIPKSSVTRSADEAPSYYRDVLNGYRQALSAFK